MNSKPLSILKQLFYIVLLIPALTGFSISLYLAWTSFPEPASTSAALGAAATIVIASLTLVLAVETWALRKLQNKQILDAKLESIKPLVIVSLEEGCVINDRNFMVQNVGKGIAYDLSFEITKGKREFQIEESIASNLSDHGFFSNGMKFLGIGQSIESHVFLFHEFKSKGDIFEALFFVAVSYQDALGNAHRNDFTFDFREYKNMNRLGDKPEREIVKNLKGVNSALSRIQQDLRSGIRVNTYDRAERKEENDQAETDYKQLLGQVTSEGKTGEK